MKRRTTPENITELKDNEIFVFGSNLIGVHGAGAAKKAIEFGAEKGNPIGRQGNTYAIPTKDAYIKNALSINEIEAYIKTFIDYAKITPEFTYLVTPIGCGLAGYSPKEIAPLFSEALKVDNIHLPKSFWIELKDNINKFTDKTIITYLKEKFDKSENTKEDIEICLNFAINMFKNLDGKTEEKINKLLEVREKLINFEL